jgi:hypothetical protein
VGAEAYIRAIAYREGIGNDLAEGLMRAAQKWGTAKKDLETGRLFMPGYGIMWHSWFPAVYWGYGSILSDRDINEHEFSSMPTYLPADEVIKRYTDILSPYNDPFMMDYNWQGTDGSNMAAAKATGIYSERNVQDRINQLVVAYPRGPGSLRKTRVVLRPRQNSRQRIEFKYVRMTRCIQTHIDAAPIATPQNRVGS